jgi:hypothetical protein
MKHELKRSTALVLYERPPLRFPRGMLFIRRARKGEVVKNVALRSTDYVACDAAGKPHSAFTSAPAAFYNLTSETCTPVWMH